MKRLIAMQNEYSVRAGSTFACTPQFFYAVLALAAFVIHGGMDHLQVQLAVSNAVDWRLCIEVQDMNCFCVSVKTSETFAECFVHISLTKLFDLNSLTISDRLKKSDVSRTDTVFELRKAFYLRMDVKVTRESRIYICFPWFVF